MSLPSAPDTDTPVAVPMIVPLLVSSESRPTGVLMSAPTVSPLNDTPWSRTISPKAPVKFTLRVPSTRTLRMLPSQSHVCPPSCTPRYSWVACPSYPVTEPTVCAIAAPEAAIKAAATTAALRARRSTLRVAFPWLLATSEAT